MYEKLHVTPDEIKSWGLSGGKQLKTFDTDCAKIGILICYDVEFPELSRLMADQGMQILFVPFLTDTQNAYSRVRVCAQARAIENECFVVIAGSVGNLPRFRFSDRRKACRSNSEYRNDPGFGCRSRLIERTAHLRQRSQPEGQEK